MEQYIPKDALLAEIEKRLDKLYELLPDASKVENGSITTSEACNTGKYTALESFRRFIDTIAVKEVDLDLTLDIDDVLKNNGINPYTTGAKIIKEALYKAIDKHISKAQKGENI